MGHLQDPATPRKRRGRENVGTMGNKRLADLLRASYKELLRHGKFLDLGWGLNYPRIRELRLLALERSCNKMDAALREVISRLKED